MTSEVQIALITAVAGFLASLTAAIFAYLNQRKLSEVKKGVAEVHTEVKTANALKLGEKADMDEYRRINLIPVGERTIDEAEHVVSVDQSQVAKEAIKLEEAVKVEKAKPLPDPPKR